MSRYAERTKVPIERSRDEIERVLKRYGADQFMYGWRDGAALIAFRAQGRQIRFVLPTPDDPQEARQRWRALVLVIKAKLEAVESGIVTFEDEFLAHIVLPDGQRVGEWLEPRLALAYESGKMPPLLPAPDSEE